jgi:hypothetical protein
MVLPVTLRVRAIFPRIARQRRASNGVTPLARVTRLCFVRAATEHISSVAQERVARTIALHAKGVEQSIIADDHLLGLTWRQIVGKSRLANLGRIIRPLIPVSNKVRQLHPFDDKSIRRAGVPGGNFDCYV